jgi:hypothetical protein
MLAVLEMIHTDCTFINFFFFSKLYRYKFWKVPDGVSCSLKSVLDGSYNSTDSNSVIFKQQIFSHTISQDFKLLKNSFCA